MIEQLRTPGLSSGTGPAWCQTADELRATYFRGDLSRMEEAARAGDARAEAWMGLMPQNRGRRLEAKEWLRSREVQSLGYYQPCPYAPRGQRGRGGGTLVPSWRRRR